MANSNAPYIINVGRGIRAKIWTNNGSKGLWYNATIARTYRDKDGELQDSDSYSRDDLLHLARVAGKAFDYVNQQLHQED